MAEAVVLDTSVLPVRRGLTGPLWMSLRKLCEVASVRVVVPELVVLESVNLRRQEFDKAATAFLDAHSRIEKHYDVDPIYVPSADEVGAAWEEELRAAFDVEETDGEDAIEALRREASRVRPARNGRGARDSAIWRTVMRLARHRLVYFVSANTADFAASKTGSLHPMLAEEVASGDVQVTYLTSVYGLIDRLATTVEAPEIQASAVETALADEIRERVMTIADTDERYVGVQPTELRTEGISLVGLDVKKAYSVDDRNLALVVGSGLCVVGAPADDQAIEFKLTAWLDFGSPEEGIVTGEVEMIELV